TTYEHLHAVTDGSRQTSYNRETTRPPTARQEDLMRGRRLAMTVAIGVASLATQLVFAQGVDDLRKQFDAGQYQQVISSAGNADDPRVVYLVAMSHQKLRHPDDAR